MLQNHNFDQPQHPHNRPLLRIIWLPATVLAAGSLLIVGALAGVNIEIIKIGSNILSGSVVAYVFFVFCAAHHRNREVKAKIAALARGDNSFDTWNDDNND